MLVVSVVGPRFCEIVSSYFSHACSIVYFTFCIIAILTALNSGACTFVTCFSINTQQSILDLPSGHLPNDQRAMAVNFSRKGNRRFGWHGTGASLVESVTLWRRIPYLYTCTGWLGGRVVSVLDSGAEGPGFKSQPRRCRLTVLGNCSHPLCLCSSSSKTGSNPREGCSSNCMPGGK